MRKEINDGNLLRHLMWKHDVTVAELATKAGVTTQTIRNFWKDRVTIAVERDLWTAMYLLKRTEIGAANFNSFLEQYYTKKRLQIMEACSLMSPSGEVETW